MLCNNDLTFVGIVSACRKHSTEYGYRVYLYFFAEKVYEGAESIWKEFLPNKKGVPS